MVPYCAYHDLPSVACYVAIECARLQRILECQRVGTMQNINIDLDLTTATPIKLQHACCRWCMPPPGHPRVACCHHACAAAWPPQPPPAACAAQPLGRPRWPPIECRAEVTRVGLAPGLASRHNPLATHNLPGGLAPPTLCLCSSGRMPVSSRLFANSALRAQHGSTGTERGGGWVDGSG